MKEHFEWIKEVLEAEKEDDLAPRTAEWDKMIKEDNIRASWWQKKQEKKRRERDQIKTSGKPRHDDSECQNKET